MVDTADFCCSPNICNENQRSAREIFKKEIKERDEVSERKSKEKWPELEQMFGEEEVGKMKEINIRLIEIDNYSKGYNILNKIMKDKFIERINGKRKFYDKNKFSKCDRNIPNNG
ncbi:hypothetical protein C1645_837708 [Glomus cerebriforme]|uniref:Uncharacterized protein n=1 Tax=Glomus cerebriforme TaxID=658196 RepID=A0A397S689_9GLOM|nr:hypothetical protein C1645_837708 [Glomus cerebriforme]